MAWSYFDAPFNSAGLVPANACCIMRLFPRNRQNEQLLCENKIKFGLDFTENERYTKHTTFSKETL